MTTDRTSPTPNAEGAAAWRDVPIDWEALEDAFENNAPEVHSYLHVPTGDVLRIVDGVADPQMHARIAADPSYLRIEPVSSREQYRWMERFIPMVEDRELTDKLTRAIDGKGAFRRFKDVLMSYGPERERWFAFRSERLRIFMEAWLNAHALNPIKRAAWVPPEPAAEAPPSQPRREASSAPPPRRSRTSETLRRQLRDVIDTLGPRELDQLSAFADFLRARRAARPSSAGQSTRGLDEPDKEDAAPESEKTPESAQTPESGPASTPTRKAPRQRAAASD
jgi:hypothetical protein